MKHRELMKNAILRSLSFWTLLGLVAGVVIGEMLVDKEWSTGLAISEHNASHWLEVFDVFGNVVFLGLLKMLVLPLIAVSVIGGVAHAAEGSTLKRLGAITLGYYFATMLIAAFLGVVCVIIIEPGAALSSAGGMFSVAAEAPRGAPLPSLALAQERAHESGLRSFAELFFTDNIFRTLVSGKVLPLILFSLFFGVIVALGGTRTQAIRELVESIFEVLVGMVRVVLWLTPLGVFCLVAHSVAQFGIGSLGGSLGLYAATVVIGLVLHSCVILTLILWIFSRERPWPFLRSMRQALLTACATCSSSATLPVSLDCCSRHPNVSRDAARLVLPLGATINMDGTALYEAVAVVFLAQAYGIALGPVELALIVGTATLAAMGAASIPSAGLVTMVIVIEAVNSSLLAANPNAALIPLAGIGLILAIDRPLDMLRTTVNVWGDVIGTRIVSGLAASSKART